MGNASTASSIMPLLFKRVFMTDGKYEELVWRIVRIIGLPSNRIIKRLLIEKISGLIWGKRIPYLHHKGEGRRGKRYKLYGKKMSTYKYEKCFWLLLVITAWRYQDCYFLQLFSFLCINLDGQALTFFLITFNFHRLLQVSKRQQLSWRYHTFQPQFVVRLLLYPYIWSSLFGAIFQGRRFYGLSLLKSLIQHVREFLDIPTGINLKSPFYFKRFAEEKEL
jgi:hypothetical protein